MAQQPTPAAAAPSAWTTARSGGAKFGAFKVGKGKHDDMVTAVGLAVQEKPRRWAAY